MSIHCCTKESSLVLGSGDNHGYMAAGTTLIVKADVSCKYEKGTCTKCTLDLSKGGSCLKIYLCDKLQVFLFANVVVETKL